MKDIKSIQLNHQDVEKKQINLQDRLKNILESWKKNMEV